MEFTLCLTHACNLRCAYCYAGRKFPAAMTWAVAERAVDFSLGQTIRQAALSGRPPVSQLGFFGGEPLLEWPLLQRATAYAMKESERLGIRLRKTLTTNMTLLDGGKAAWLKSHGFFVGLSLDGNAAMHDTLRRFRNGRGSHAVCRPALDYFRGPGAPAEVIVVPDPRNIGHLADSVKWLMEQDVRRIALNPNFYTVWPKTALSTWKKALRQIGALYLERYRAGEPVRINVIDGKIRAHLQGGYAPCDRCGFGEKEIAVAPSGNMYPCERVVGDDAGEALRIGDVFKGFDPERRASILARRGNTVEACSECALRERCMNWCCCINQATTGAIDRVDGLVCFHERMTIAEADRVGAVLYAESNPAFLAAFYGRSAPF
jgi:uncharacterized protein